MSAEMHERDWRDDLYVFPVDGKRPKVRHWREESAPWDEWTGRWPKGAGFGIDCGKSGLVVVDEDELGAVDAWLGFTPMTYTVRTGKGRHFYFRAPVGTVVRNSAGKVAPGVDVRGEGGYVVGAGSLHPSGVRYAVVNAAEPEVLPTDLAERLVSYSRLDGLVRSVTEAQPGTGNDRLNWAAGKAGALLRDAPAAAQQAVRERLVAAFLARPGHTEADRAEAGRTVASGWDWGSENPEQALPDRSPGQVEVDGLLVDREKFERMTQERLLWHLSDRAARATMDEAEIATMPESWLTGDQVLDVPPVQPVLGHPSAPLTARGQHTLLVGPDGTGKSTFVQHYAKARLALPGWGGTMLGEPVESLPEDARVLYLAVDRPTQILEGFRRGLDPDDADLRAMLRDRLIVWPGPPPSPLWEKAGRLWLLRAIEERNIRMVVIDSRKDVGDTLEQREVTGFARLTKHLDADEVDLVMPHHNVQSADRKKGADLTDTFGLREVYSGAGSVLTIKGDPGAEVVTLHQTKPIRDLHAPIRVRVAHMAGRVELAGAFAVVGTDGEVDVDARGGPGDVDLDALVALHSELLHRGETTRTDLTGKGREGTERRRLLDRLIAAEVVTEVPRERSKYVAAVDLSESTVRSRLAGHSA